MEEAQSPPENAEPRARVLLVEDEAQIREPYCELLIEAGFDVVPVCDGEEAVQKLNGESAFDAVVTDVRMPRMNGIELLELINQQHPELSSRAIVISGFVDDDFSLPPHFVLLRKPCDTDNLLNALQACTSRQGWRRAVAEYQCR